jgi:hypothetical protein
MLDRRRALQCGVPASPSVLASGARAQRKPLTKIR